jgi:hypothetical protein
MEFKGELRFEPLQEKYTNFFTIYPWTLRQFLASSINTRKMNNSPQAYIELKVDLLER